MTIDITASIALLSCSKASINSSILKYPLSFYSDHIRRVFPDWKTFCHNSFDICASGMIWGLRRVMSGRRVHVWPRSGSCLHVAITWRHAWNLSRCDWERAKNRSGMRVNRTSWDACVALLALIAASPRCFLTDGMALGKKHSTPLLKFRLRILDPLSFSPCTPLQEYLRVSDLISWAYYLLYTRYTRPCSAQQLSFFRLFYRFGSRKNMEDHSFVKDM